MFLALLILLILILFGGLGWGGYSYRTGGGYYGPGGLVGLIVLLLILLLIFGRGW